MQLFFQSLHVRFHMTIQTFRYCFFAWLTSYRTNVIALIHFTQSRHEIMHQQFAIMGSMFIAFYAGLSINMTAALIMECTSQGGNYLIEWASCQIRKIAFFPPPRVSDPDMHHGTCVTDVPWCMPASLTSGFLWSWRRGNVPGIPGACTNRNFTYLARVHPQKYACGSYCAFLPVPYFHRNSDRFRVYPVTKTQLCILLAIYIIVLNLLLIAAINMNETLSMLLWNETLSLKYW